MQFEIDVTIRPTSTLQAEMDRRQVNAEVSPTRAAAQADRRVAEGDIDTTEVDAEMTPLRPV